MRIPCKVILKGVGPTRIHVIAALRDITPGFSIGQRQEYLEHLPRVVAADIDEHEADRMARDLRSAGAVVDVEKPVFSVKIVDWLKEKCDVETFRLENSSGFGDRPIWQVFDEDMQPGDEIWTFSSPAIFWENLCGRAGYALVREGTIISSVLTEMN